MPSSTVLLTASGSLKKAAVADSPSLILASEKVGVQLALCVARVMRSEANRGQATVLETFAEALRREAALPGHALLALLYTGKELRSMRLPAQRRLAAAAAALAERGAARRGAGGGRHLPSSPRGGEPAFGKALGADPAKANNGKW